MGILLTPICPLLTLKLTHLQSSLLSLRPHSLQGGIPPADIRAGTAVSQQCGFETQAYVMLASTVRTSC